MDRKTEYNLEYAKKNVRQVNLKFNLNTDTDILEQLDSVDNIQNYIKTLIRSDIENGKARNKRK